MDYDQMHDPELIASALSHVPADDRDLWVRMAMAVKSALGEDGFSIWNEWSQTSPKYMTADAKSVWRSVSADGKTTIRSVLHEARVHGWTDDSEASDPLANMVRRAQAEERRAKEEAERTATKEETASRASALWQAADEAWPGHPYVSRKRIKPRNLCEIELTAAISIIGYHPRSSGHLLQGRLLVVPVMRLAGSALELSTCELIDGDGYKAALCGPGTKTGAFWPADSLPPLDHVGPLVIAEGVATTASIFEATGFHAVAALSSSNLANVAQEFRKAYPKTDIIVAADLDKKTGKPDANAIKAAASVNGKLAVPDFGSARAEGEKDFNDQAVRLGLGSVQAAILAAEPVAPQEGSFKDGGSAGTSSDDASSGHSRQDQHGTSETAWGTPEPLGTELDPLPYPIDALPDNIRRAVEEVQAFVQAPLGLVASSAISSLSLAAQAHADVQRSVGLTGPSGLFLLTIGESGERKSSCDRYFIEPVRDYETEAREAAKPALRDFAAKKEAWEAQRRGIKDKIRKAAKEGKATAVGAAEADLRRLEETRPVPPRIPRLIFTDATPEALAFTLGTHWPSGGVISSEAGLVLGSHGMNKDAVMRNLGLLNQLWDGIPLHIDRRTTESFKVSGARLTVALQTQGATLEEFMERTGQLARGMGFLARFLCAIPESTQGTRFFKEPPAAWISLNAFTERLGQILRQQAPIRDDGGLEPVMLKLSGPARERWKQYHDAVEAELRADGELADVKDVASKSADNAARLACLFHVFEHGPSGEISEQHMSGACELAAWYLHESRRLLMQHALPQGFRNAIVLDRWMIGRCKAEGVDRIALRALRQKAPRSVRDKVKLAGAIKELQGLGRARPGKDGKTDVVCLNPALLKA